MSSKRRNGRSDDSRKFVEHHRRRRARRTVTFDPLVPLEQRWLPSTFPVINTNDSGAGSLRQAIINANGTPGSTIDFTIASSGVQTIHPLSMLPAMTAAGTIVNGYTEAGSSVNTSANSDNAVITVFLDGQGSDHFLGLYVTASNVTISGLAIGGFQGNASAIEVANSGVSGVAITGNFLGTQPDGTTADGNAQGVLITNFPTNITIGGTTPAARNLISGNTNYGIWFGGQDSGNLVQGNFIGTNEAGTAALGNASSGIEIDSGALSNTVGGTTAGAANVISGNTNDGVDIIGSGTSNNLVEGNRIGLNAKGTAAVGNGGSGVLINAASNNTIGGTAAGAGNVVSGNHFDGIYLLGSGTTGNVIAGNLVGTDATGTVALGNVFYGVEIFGQASNNTIGGTAAGAGNVISGNLSSGVYLSFAGTTGNLIAGNLIGTNAAGTAAIANSINGILLDGGAAGNTVGGTTAGARNIISGNGGDGIAFAGTGTDQNVVTGNYIGTDKTGTVALANSGSGVIVSSSASAETIGGSAAGAGNVISGNTANGVDLQNGDGTLLVTSNGGPPGLSLRDSQTGSLISSLPGSTNANAAIIGPDGSFYVVDSGSQIIQYAPDGSTILATIAVPTAAALTFGAGGELYATSGNSIVQIAPDLSSESTFVSAGSAGLTTAGGLVFGPDGNLYVSDSSTGSVLRYSATTGLPIGTGVFVSAGSGGLTQPNALTFGPDGNLYVSDASVGAIFQFNGASGSFLSKLITGLDHPVGVGFDQLGDIDVLSNGTLANYDPSGNPLTTLSGAFGDVSLFEAPNNVVQGNVIGTTQNGQLALPNAQDGIALQASPDNLIGGFFAGEGNLTSGNTFYGIELTGASTGNVLERNSVGLNSGGDTAIANGAAGIQLDNGAYHNTIGGLNTLHPNGTIATLIGNVVSGNIGRGIDLYNAGTNNNLIEGNLVGVAPDGSNSIPNTIDGLTIEAGAASNTVGGTASGAANILSGNTAAGASEFGTGTGNIFVGNFIGTNALGSSSISNGTDGLVIDGTQVTVGGTTAAARNVIASPGANTLGAIFISGATTVLVEGNYLGMTPDGTAALGSGTASIEVYQSTGVTIGGAVAPASGLISAAANVISANSGEGIQNDSNGTLIEGNLIGTNPTGTAAVGAGGFDIWLSSGNDATIGGTIPYSGNLLSNAAGGPGDAAIIAEGNATTGTLIEGNLIGTDITGTTAIPNSYGFRLQNGTFTIGGTTVGARNVISGNTYGGIDIESTGNDQDLIEGNYIGITADGNHPLGDGVGVHVAATSSGDTIGGAVPGAGNVISANAFDGISVAGSNTKVFLNKIGTNAGGTATIVGIVNVMANGTGVDMFGGSGDQISNNLISGNTNFGLTIEGSGSTVVGNFIGTDPTGASAIPNGADGILLDNGATGNTIGASNVISGNSEFGISFTDAGTSGNFVVGNLIGTDPTGTLANPNGFGGVYISTSSTGNTIGGTEENTPNVISGNSGNGVTITDAGTSNNVVLGNLIGTDLSGTIRLANIGSGVAIDNNASDNTIGGSVGNVISANTVDGVYLGSSGNAVSRNQIGTNSSGTETPNTVGNQFDGVEVVTGNDNMITGNVISGNGGTGVHFDSGASSGSVGWWQANGNANDTTQGHDGTLVNFNAFGDPPPGHIGQQSFSLRGSDTSPQYVQVPYSPVLDPQVFSISAWVNPTANGADQTIVSNEPSIVSGQTGYGLRLRADGTFWFTIGADGADTFVQSFTVAAPNHWYHVVGTYDGGTISLYVNGVQENDNSATATINSTMPLQFGALATTGHEDFNGHIGDLALFDRTLTSGDVSTLYSGQESLVAGSNLVQNNKIGTDSSGLAAVANGADGITISTSNVLVGGPTSGQGNVLSGNTGNGLSIEGSASWNNVVQGNTIGLKSDASATLQNSYGVYVAAPDNVIGGDSATTHAGNVIAGNFNAGVYLNGGAATGNLVVEMISGPTWPGMRGWGTRETASPSLTAPITTRSVRRRTAKATSSPATASTASISQPAATSSSAIASGSRKPVRRWQTPTETAWSSPPTSVTTPSAALRWAPAISSAARRSAPASRSTASRSPPASPPGIRARATPTTRSATRTERFTTSTSPRALSAGASASTAPAAISGWARRPLAPPTSRSRLRSRRPPARPSSSRSLVTAQPPATATTSASVSSTARWKPS